MTTPLLINSGSGHHSFGTLSGSGLLNLTSTAGAAHSFTQITGTTRITVTGGLISTLLGQFQAASLLLIDGQAEVAPGSSMTISGQCATAGSTATILATGSLSAVSCNGLVADAETTINNLQSSISVGAIRGLGSLTAQSGTSFSAATIMNLPWMTVTTSTFTTVSGVITNVGTLAIFASTTMTLNGAVSLVSHIIFGPTVASTANSIVNCGKMLLTTGSLSVTNSDVTLSGNLVMEASASLTLSSGASLIANGACINPSSSVSITVSGIGGITCYGGTVANGVQFTLQTALGTSKLGAISGSGTLQLSTTSGVASVANVTGSLTLQLYSTSSGTSFTTSSGGISVALLTVRGYKLFINPGSNLIVSSTTILQNVAGIEFNLGG